MNLNIRNVIRLKSPSIKLLWLLIYNLYATGRLILMIIGPYLFLPERSEAPAHRIFADAPGVHELKEIIGAAGL